MDNINTQQNINENQQQINHQQQEQFQQQYTNLTNTSDNDDYSANALAWSSIACMICSRLMNILAFIFSMMLTSVHISEDIAGMLSTVISAFSSMVNLTGLVIMIVTRIKYPNNKVGKAAMWIYIALTILEVILYILAVVACISMGIYLIESCSGVNF